MDSDKPSPAHIIIVEIGSDDEVELDQSGLLSPYIKNNLNKDKIYLVTVKAEDSEDPGALQTVTLEICTGKCWYPYGGTAPQTLGPEPYMFWALSQNNTFLKKMMLSTLKGIVWGTQIWHVSRPSRSWVFDQNSNLHVLINKGLFILRRNCVVLPGCYTTPSCTEIAMLLHCGVT